MKTQTGIIILLSIIVLVLIYSTIFYKTKADDRIFIIGQIRTQAGDIYNDLNNSTDNSAIQQKMNGIISQTDIAFQ